MSYSENIPTCDHIRCEHPHRLEYCEIEARDPEGDSATTIEMIDHLLYERGDFERGISYINDGEIKYISREFEYIHGDTETWAWPLLETRLAIVHEQNERLNYDIYATQVSWRSHQQGAPDAFYSTTYTIEQWPRAIHATVDEYDISTEQLKTHQRPMQYSRPMTGYDYELLFKSLAELEGMRIAEERDNIIRS